VESYFHFLKGENSVQKLLIFLLVAALLAPCILTGCNSVPSEQTTPTATSPKNTTFENTTPEITTPDSGEIVPPPASDGSITSDGVLKRATVITGESEVEKFAGRELTSYLRKKGVQVVADAFPIFLFTDPTLENDSFLIDATLFGEEASLTVRGGGESGVLYGVYRFLEKFAGVRYFTPGLEKIPEGDIVLRDGSLLSYSPTFEYRYSNWFFAEQEDAALWNVKVGMNGNPHITPQMGSTWNYGDMFVHTIGWLSETGNSMSPNPCLSDPQILATVIANVRTLLAEDPSINIISISQNDNVEYCTCAKCAAVDAEEGSPAGLMLRFVNAVAADLEKDYPNLVIDTLAYKYTQSVPYKTVPRHNVCVRVCPIHRCFTHPLDTCNYDSNISFRQDFKAWSKICDRIYLWDYTTNYRYYVPIFPNFGTLRENIRYYAENHVRGMFPQGNYQSVSGEFAELRTYLLAQLMWDPYMSEEEYNKHMDEFLEAYYGAGWQGIRQYINKTAELADDVCMTIYYHPYEIISKEEYLANEADFEIWWTTAEELAGDRAPFVRRSRLQWRYIQQMLHPTTKDEAYALFYEIYRDYEILFAESYQYNAPPEEWFGEAS
jgi:hypothetical protein